MKLLFLGNSNEFYGDLAGEDRRAARVARSLEAALGEPVDVTVRQIWPTDSLPGRLEAWMDELEPDIVYLNVVSFWFVYQSVPLRFERRFGRIGRPLKSAGIRASQVPWLGHTSAFHWVRRQSQKLIGGATFFEPDDIVAVMSDCIRVATRHEQAMLVVKGPRSRTAHNVTERSRAWAEDRRRRVHNALSALCGSLHVEYVGSERPRYLTEPGSPTLGDRLHSGSEGHSSSGDEIAGLLAAAWQRQHAPAASRPS